MKLYAWAVLVGGSEGGCWRGMDWASDAPPLVELKQNYPNPSIRRPRSRSR